MTDIKSLYIYDCMTGKLETVFRCLRAIPGPWLSMSALTNLKYSDDNKQIPIYSTTEESLDVTCRSWLFLKNRAVWFSNGKTTKKEKMRLVK